MDVPACPGLGGRNVPTCPGVGGGGIGGGPLGIASSRHSSALVDTAGGATGAVWDQAGLDSGNTAPARGKSTAPQRISAIAITSILGTLKCRSN